jgi:hypothetical protein
VLNVTAPARHAALTRLIEANGWHRAAREDWISGRQPLTKSLDSFAGGEDLAAEFDVFETLAV